MHPMVFKYFVVLSLYSIALDLYVDFYKHTQ